MPDEQTTGTETASTEQETNASTEEEFDKDRALATIKKQRDVEKQLKAKIAELAPKAAKADELAEATKSEQEKAAEKAAAAERRATEAEKTALRIEVALDKAPEGMPVAQIRKLAKRLAGDTREELEADADELFADFAPDDDAAKEPKRRPQERLKPGAVPGAEPEDTEPGLPRLMRAYAKQ